MTGKKTMIRYVSYMFIIIVGVLFIEGGIYNFHPLITRDPIEIVYKIDTENTTENCQVTEVENGFHFLLNEPAFIKKAEIQYSGDEETKLYLSMIEKNAFAQEKDIFLEDTYYPELGTSCTNINKTVTAFMVVKDKHSRGDFIRIRLFTSTQFNKVRMLFWAVVLFIVCLFFEKRDWVVNHPEWIMAVTCLCMGVTAIYGQGINGNGWDEQIHFQRAYEISYGKKVVADDAVRILEESLSPTISTTAEERSLAIQYVQNQVGVNPDVQDASWKFGYNSIAYLPMSLALLIGRMLRFPLYWQYMAGKVINLLTYILLMFFSIKIIPEYKTVAAALAMIPTQIFEASCYTYDAIMLGLLTLGICCWLRVLHDDYSGSTKWYISGSILFISLGVTVKMVYIPLLLLCCTYSCKKFSGKMQYRIYRGIIAALFLAGMALLAFPTIDNLLRNNIGWGGDLRGGQTDAVGQMKTILGAPFAYIKMLTVNILKTLPNYTLGIEAMINFGRYNALGFPYLYLLPLWFVLIWLHPDWKEIEIKLTEKVVIAVSILGAVALIWTSMYLAFTPVGEGVINGVQGRYYAPLLFPMFCAFGKRGVSIIRISNKCYSYLILGIPIVLFMAGLYITTLKAYVF